MKLRHLIDLPSSPASSLLYPPAPPPQRLASAISAAMLNAQNLLGTEGRPSGKRCISPQQHDETGGSAAEDPCQQWNADESGGV